MGLAYEGKEYGDDCLRCFGEGYTPKYIMASFEGIEPTDWVPPIPPFPPYPDPNITLMLTQTVEPCTWLGNLGYWNCLFYIDDDGSHLGLYGTLPYDQAFAGFNAEQCKANFSNVSQDPEADVTFYGGYGQIAAI